MLIRKAIILVLLGMISFSSPLMAQETETEKLELIKEILVTTKALDLFDTMQAASLEQFDRNLAAQNIELTPAQNAAAKEVMVEVFKEMKDDLMVMQINIHADNFSKEELEQLVEFYKSDLGQMFINKMPQITGKILQETSTMMQKIQPEIQRRISEKFDELAAQETES